MSSTNSLECPGLPAEWVNGWLAAVGTTVLDPEIQLSWTPDRSAIAVLHHPVERTGGRSRRCLAGRNAANGHAAGTRSPELSCRLWG